MATYFIHAEILTNDGVAIWKHSALVVASNAPVAVYQFNNDADTIKAKGNCELVIDRIEKVE